MPEPQIRQTSQCIALRTCHETCGINYCQKRVYIPVSQIKQTSNKFTVCYTLRACHETFVLIHAHAKLHSHKRTLVQTVTTHTANYYCLNRDYMQDGYTVV